jgi:UTP--glucose-1-phosphate uridylyltransferase
VPEDQTQSYGIIEGEEIEDGLYKVSNMIEKPAPEDAPTNLAIIGRYILTPDIFDIIRNLKPGAGGEIQITDAICEQAKNGKVLAYKFKGRRFDCGNLEGFVEATNHIFQKQHDAG